MERISTHRLTDQQRAFAVAYTLDHETVGNAAASATKAGYAQSSARQEGYRLLRKDGVRAEIDRLTREAIGDHAVGAVSLLGRVINDEDAPIKVRVDACKTILDRAGFIAPKASEPDDFSDEKDPNDMSLEELMATARKLRDEIEAKEAAQAQSAEAESQELH